MTLIEALQKYRYVTNDSGKTVYFTDAVGSIIKKGENAFLPTVELFTSTGWERYTQPLITHVDRVNDERYCYVDGFGRILDTNNSPLSVDEIRYDMYNYFKDKDMAQYVADKQLIQRINIMLDLLNKDNPDKETLIQEHIENKYKEVVDRIKEYEKREIL